MLLAGDREVRRWTSRSTPRNYYHDHPGTNTHIGLWGRFGGSRFGSASVTLPQSPSPCRVSGSVTLPSGDPVAGSSGWSRGWSAPGPVQGGPSWAGIDAGHRVKGWSDGCPDWCSKSVHPLVRNLAGLAVCSDSGSLGHSLIAFHSSVSAGVRARLCSPAVSTRVRPRRRG